LSKQLFHKIAGIYHFSRKNAPTDSKNLFYFLMQTDILSPDDCKVEKKSCSVVVALHYFLFGFADPHR